MTPHQYSHARDTLEWTHAKLAEVIGKSERESYRYASGDTDIPDTVGKLLRRLVRDRLTMSERKFDELVNQL